MHRVVVYRILYAVRRSSSIEIGAIGHRKDIYERTTSGEVLQKFDERQRRFGS